MAPNTFTLTPSSISPAAFTNKHILITGGSSGIGLSTAELLLSFSAKLTILDLNSPPSTSTLHNNMSVLVITGDIRDWKYQRAAFTQAVKHHGELEGVFVNAGIGENSDVFFTDELDKDGELKEIDHKVLDIDIRAAADTTKLAIHHMRKNNGGKGSGSIVLTASLAGYLASKGLPLYSAAKFGIVGLMRSLKNDVSRLNIAISVVAPAITVTPLLTKDGALTLDSEVSKMTNFGVPLNKVETISTATAWLLSLGQKSNGKGILCQADKLIDIEEGLATSRTAWLGDEMLGYFRNGRGMKDFSKLKSKI
ncbi:hypothetical protein TWF225_006214 [Orbilia oligospora]|nr:hypothetical protein TWF225_006214 [Orbilia oligospora]KAF3242310.1 hypothetical protein TWF128_010550 [Orbilia oligospora]KAF3242311.1 hypothetical protein TWF128_010550 [Orbilia oligospora]KAF3246835.1 hypothetical protein TWF217_009853 [Orbilia oligospora]